MSLRKFIFTITMLLSLQLALSSCVKNPNETEKPNKPHFWLYQLQNADIEAIRTSGFFHITMDYSKDGSDDGRYSVQEIQSLVEAGITPVAYISIGEAENYRFYWNQGWVRTPNGNDFTDAAPAWLGRTNPDWEGNYKIRYWDEDWQQNIIRPYLDKILSQGFQGVYLDIIDAFEYWADTENYGTGKEQQLQGDPIDDEAEAARRMIAFVKWIANYCRTNSPLGNAFLIIPQNGERILQYDSDGSYLSTVSGIGIEDLWYVGTEEQDPNELTYRLLFLEKFRAQNKLILSVDYVDNGNRTDQQNLSRIKNYLSKCATKGFFAYAARSNRELDTINVINGIQPE